MAMGAAQPIELASSEERRRCALEASRVGTWELDLTTEIVACDRFVPELFGLPPGERCPMRELLARVSYDDAARVEEQVDLARAGAHRDGVMVEYRVERAPKDVRWIEARGRVSVDEHGAPVRFMGTVVDITSRKQAEKARADELLAMLGHELRNPLAAISASLQLLGRARGDALKVARCREIAGRHMDGLVRLVDDLLDVARISRGKLERRQGIDLSEIVRGAIETARPEIEARRHRLEVSIDDGTFPMTGDAAGLAQVVVNLLANAAKYTEQGGSLAVELTREQQAGAPHAILRIVDDGRGVPAEMLHRIFDTFTQVEPGIARSGGGLGVGLTLVKGMVEQHGGRVLAMSEGPGKGTKLVVRLPIDEIAPPALPISSQCVRKVVIVEDAVDTRTMLKELLESLGHEVAVADDGDAGAARVAELRPDAAVIDIGLPMIDGYEVARRVRAQRDGDRPLLIALTGYGGPEARAKAEAAGFDLHFTKPVDMRKLFRAIERGRERVI